MFLNKFNPIDGHESHLLQMALTDPFDAGQVLGGGQAGAVDATDVADSFVPEVWGMAIENVFKEITLFDKLGIDLSDNVSSFGDTIHLPNIGVPGVQAYTQGAEIAPDVANSNSDRGTVTDLDIDQYNVSSVYIPDIVTVQSSYDLMSIYVKQLAYANARAFDNFLSYTIAKKVNDLLKSDTGVVGGDADTSLHVVTTGSVLGQANITSLYAKILAETGSTDGWSLVLSPAMMSSLNTLASYSEGTMAAPMGGDFARTGMAGNILGMPVYVTQSPYVGKTGAAVAADAAKGILGLASFDNTGGQQDDILYGFAMHESALYSAFSRKAKVTATYRHSHLSYLVTCESAYGSVVKCADAQGDRRIFSLIDYEAA
tara:strand:- start:271 stop:1386 length:1116 start_codon:yes stop_codon:yes gene_type:complete